MIELVFKLYNEDRTELLRVESGEHIPRVGDIVHLSNIVGRAVETVRWSYSVSRCELDSVSVELKP